MADNYLERKMAEHQANRPVAAPKSRAADSARRRAEDSVLAGYGNTSVYIDSPALDAATLAAVRLLRRLGLRVAFSALDAPDAHKQGTALAQETGSRFYPGSTAPQAVVDNLAAHWSGPDAVVTLGTGRCAGLWPDRVRHISIGTDRLDAVSPDVLARCVALGVHPVLGPAIAALL